MLWLIHTNLKLQPTGFRQASNWLLILELVWIELCKSNVTQLHFNSLKRVGSQSEASRLQINFGVNEPLEICVVKQRVHSLIQEVYTIRFLINRKQCIWITWAGWRKLCNRPVGGSYIALWMMAPAFTCSYHMIFPHRISLYSVLLYLNEWGKDSMINSHIDSAYASHVLRQI